MVSGAGSGSRVNGGGRGGSEEGAAKKGPWTAAEDAILMEYVRKHGEGNWNSVQRNSGLLRCGKSCRLRWANHLRPNLKKGSFSPEEERLIIQLHAKLGNKWARMASQVLSLSLLVEIVCLEITTTWKVNYSTVTVCCYHRLMIVARRITPKISIHYL